MLARVAHVSHLVYSPIEAPKSPLPFSPSPPLLLLLASGSTLPGGTPGQLALGLLLLDLWPVLFVLLSFAVVWYVVVQEQFARFFVREMTEPRTDGLLAAAVRSFWSLLRQKRLKGHWVTITPSHRHILPRFGLFFEDFTGTGRDRGRDGDL